MLSAAETVEVVCPSAYAKKGAVIPLADGTRPMQSAGMNRKSLDLRSSAYTVTGH
jgi:hypothetical protein